MAASFFEGVRKMITEYNKGSKYEAALERLQSSDALTDESDYEAIDPHNKPPEETELLPSDEEVGDAGKIIEYSISRGTRPSGGEGSE